MGLAGRLASLGDGGEEVDVIDIDGGGREAGIVVAHDDGWDRG